MLICYGPHMRIINYITTISTIISWTIYRKSIRLMQQISYSEHFGETVFKWKAIRVNLFFFGENLNIARNG